MSQLTKLILFLNVLSFGTIFPYGFQDSQAMARTKPWQDCSSPDGQYAWGSRACQVPCTLGDKYYNNCGKGFRCEKTIWHMGTDRKHIGPE